MLKLAAERWLGATHPNVTSGKPRAPEEYVDRATRELVRIYGDDGDHAQHAHAAQAGEAAEGAATADPAPSKAGHGDQKKCSACASCCSVAVVQSIDWAVPIPTFTKTVFATVAAGFGAFAADGPERPPRSPLA